jgi:hypothetical protein
LQKLWQINGDESEDRRRYIMAEEKINFLAQCMMQFALEEIREHRRKIGHDPVWWADEELLMAWYEKALYYVKSIVEEGENG